MFDTFYAAADRDPKNHDHDGMVREAVAAGMPEPLATAFLALSYQREHSYGVREVISDFDEVVTTYLAAMAKVPKPKGLFDDITLTRGVRERRLRRPRFLGDMNAALYLPNAEGRDYLVQALVALSDGTHRTLSFDIRELASAMWKNLGA